VGDNSGGEKKECRKALVQSKEMKKKLQRCGGRKTGRRKGVLGEQNQHKPNIIKTSGTMNKHPLMR